MRSIFVRAGWAFFTFLLFSRPSPGQALVRVQEAETRIRFRSGTPVVDLPIENASRTAVPAHVILEFVDPKGAVQARAEQEVTILPGVTHLTVPFPASLARNGNLEIGDLLWLRLRYALRPEPDPGSVPALSAGVLSAGAAAADIFELHVGGPFALRNGGRYIAHVRAIHPVTGRPVSGVLVQAFLNPDADGEETVATNPATTDSQGFAGLTLPLPAALKDSYQSIKVTGRLGDYIAEAENDFPIDHFPEVYLRTDKPLYQPGQVVHARLLAFGPEHKAIQSEGLVLKILDPERTLVYRTVATTSDFGIASADWQIPENLRLGTYRLQADFEGDRYPDNAASIEFKISRYDLPTFSVLAKPDRAYYLPGQDASVEVHADYLYGEPVRHGHVRVVREDERNWNYREQRWEVKEGAHYEGDTDDRGRFIAHVELSADHDKLRGYDFERFEDLSFAAYFTDSSTGRTEQRRFDLRISKDPIHVYVKQATGSQPKGLPLEFYLTTDYADGAPVPCQVEIYWAGEQEDAQAAASVAPGAQLLRRVHTNRYGVAKVSGLHLPATAESGRFYLRFLARDGKGAEGDHREAMYYPDHPGIRVVTNKILYQPGEPIEIQLQASEPELIAVLEAQHDFQVLTSRLVRIRRGRAFVRLATNQNFQNTVDILAYAFGFKPGVADSGMPFMGTRTMLFPKDHSLKVDVKLAKASFRPGEQAGADLRVTPADGNSARTALGLVVVDRAVEERQKTDSDFGRRGWFLNFSDLEVDPEELGGVRKSDLEKIDLSKPLPDGLELVAEILLQPHGVPPQIFSSDAGAEDLRELFQSEIEPAVQAIRAALSARYLETGEYPRSGLELESLLEAAGVRWKELRDPWGSPYRAEFLTRRESDVLKIWSAGPDKISGTEDDFTVAELSWPYFKPVTEAIERAVNGYHARTGAYIRDRATLAQELAAEGIALEALKDRWGRAYRWEFGIDGPKYMIYVSSAGPDGRFDTQAAPSEDDFRVASVAIDYFQEMRARLDSALHKHFENRQSFPENLDELRRALEESGIRWEELRDPWGHPYYATFRREARYADDLNVQTYAQLVQQNQQHLRVVPITQQIDWIYIRSSGRDGKEGTADDFDVARFSRGVVQQSSEETVPIPVNPQIVLAGESGAISGTVVDPSGAAVSGTTVSARNGITQQTFTTETDAEGHFLISNLPAGAYTVQASAKGFRTVTVMDVPVRSSSATQVNLTLQLGAATEVVEVSAGANVELQTLNATVAERPGTLPPPRALPAPQISTPRLREYFPETLLWQPEVITDTHGRAQIKFPLADNITTWKLSAVASTVEGELGSAEKEIRVFQPFFVEHDPPRFLTAGDEIALPVVLRNYLARPLRLNVELKPAPWFSLLGVSTAKTEVSARDSATDIFRFRAVASVRDGKQEVSAIGIEASDAISRPVTVRPNGEEKTETVSQVFQDSAALDVVIPENAIPGSIEATLKIYPNLAAHVLESIEAILERPHGCGEQTISSTYPSLLLLKLAKGSGEKDSAHVLRARRYAQIGYERLLSYRAPSGGFSYWGRGEADLALTVYALRFLKDASEFVDVDDSVAQEALDWVLKQAQQDGHWIARNGQGAEDARRSLLLTAYVARMLAASGLAAGGHDAKPAVAKSASAALRRALDFLEPHVAGMDEPYTIASYALATRGAGQESAFKESLDKLRALERREAGMSYWMLEVNTPFYGWGLTGRVETTALVLQALSVGEQSDETRELLSRGLLFLLRRQDRYGIWYSTQATINVLDAMVSLTVRERGVPNLTSEMGGAAEARVTVDGAPAGSVTLPADSVLSGPVRLALPQTLSPGKHRVEIHRAAGSASSSAQLLADYYIPWTHSPVESDLHHEQKSSDALRLAVHFSKQSAGVGEDLECAVEAERIGYRGYGMLLAEIGLPPGAEVDRGSLEQAMNASGWDIEEYDVLPDRLIVYLWPHAGGTKFSFRFKPRFSLKALSAPSVLYDYYNPDARAVIAPTLFTVN